jgi:hypothetical protein
VCGVTGFEICEATAALRTVRWMTVSCRW